MMNIKEKMHNSHIYDPNEPSLFREQLGYIQKVNDYNNTKTTQLSKRMKMLKDMFSEIGEGCYIEPPFHANFGGHHVHLGKKVYANFNLTLVDDTHIYIGDYTMIGPNVTIVTAAHPIEPSLRKRALQFNVPVRIGMNCWIGANAVILPGVTIGNNVVVGAGSIVTKDIPDNVVVVGNPARILREVGERDREYYFKGFKINWDEFNKE
ncbi:MAG: sugar O-acetyltransferase [Bacilli bacterium]|nr:sugar O-acetyltransferase [Bacilli bacterium]